MNFKVTCLFIFVLSTTKASEEKRSLMTKLEDRLEAKLGEVFQAATKWLEGFNDRHLAGTLLGRLIQYEKIKPRLETRSKKMSMAMLPLIFHVGASSTWMMLTALMTTKSVAIGLLLLVVKIAVFSAKASSYLTLLKAKKHQHEWSPPTHGYGHEPASYAEVPPVFEGYSYPKPQHSHASNAPLSSYSQPSSYSQSSSLSSSHSPSSYDILPDSYSSSSSKSLHTSYSLPSSENLPSSHNSQNSLSNAYSPISSQSFNSSPESFPSSQSLQSPPSPNSFQASQLNQEWVPKEPPMNDLSKYYYR